MRYVGGFGGIYIYIYIYMVLLQAGGILFVFAACGWY